MDQAGAMTVAEVDDWVQSAEPGESKVYAWGERLPRIAPGVVAAKAAHARGLITFTERRVSQGRREFIMQRLSRRARAEVSVGSAGGEVPKSSDADRVILDALRHAAAHALPCPSNDDLARRANLPDGYAASYAIGKLKKARKIRVDFVGPHKRRQITIISTGAQTGVARA
jgi:hypothetical protein